MMKSNWFIIILCLLLSGCMGTKTPPADIYTISPPELRKTIVPIQERDKGEGSMVVKLAAIRAARAFSGTEILYSHNRYAMNSYAYSRWTDAPARLLQLFFQVVLTDSGDVFTVLPSTSLARADCILESTLYDFSHHINSDGTSDGVIRIRFYLVDNSNKKVTATREFSSVVPVSSCNAMGAATALNKAALNVAGDLASWLSEHDTFI